MAICLHPFMTGVPHRIGALDKALGYIKGHERVWFATGEEIATLRGHTAVVFAVPGRGGVTIIGRAEFTDDPAVRQRVFDGMADHAKLTGAARETFLRNLGSPGRMVFRIAPERYASRNERTAAMAYASTQGMPSNYR